MHNATLRTCAACNKEFRDPGLEDTGRVIFDGCQLRGLNAYCKRCARMIIQREQREFAAKVITPGDQETKHGG